MSGLMRASCALLLCAVAACPAPPAPSIPKEAPKAPPLFSSYAETAQKIVQAAVAQNNAYQRLIELCDDIGNRLSGTNSLSRAVEWATQSLQKDAQENVHQEPVTVRRWERGKESLLMRAPREQTLSMLGLGGSVGTPAEGITADVVVVANEDELTKLGEGARGKIVLFNNPMPTYDPVKGSGYGEAVRFRGRGAVLASKQGAVAALVRSVTASSLRSPHTGAMGYRGAEVKIPAAAVSVEDAEQIARLTSRGQKVTLSLYMEAHDAGEAPSANVIAEIKGREKPEEVVILGAHLDSWDVGQGAQDDGGGCVMVMEALAVLRRLGLTPRRTIRVVLFTNEENGLAGANAYVKEHEKELPQIVAALESDSGTFAPFGLWVEFDEKDKDTARQERVQTQLKGLLELVSSLRATEVKVGHSGSDVGGLGVGGALLLGMGVEGSRYFDYHHSQADTVDKVKPEELSACVAFLAVVSYVLADMPGRIGEEKLF